MAYVKGFHLSSRWQPGRCRQSFNLSHSLAISSAEHCWFYDRCWSIPKLHASSLLLFNYNRNCRLGKSKAFFYVTITLTETPGFEDTHTISAKALEQVAKVSKTQRGFKQI
jgi:hypothetical protein